MSCCSLVHPPVSLGGHHSLGDPVAEVLEGVATPLARHRPHSRTDELVAALLAWGVGVMLTLALTAVVAMHVPVSELLALL